jgi:hypothetical protein
MRWLNARARARPRVGEPRHLTVGALRRHPWGMVWTLAVAQVISWGSLYWGNRAIGAEAHDFRGVKNQYLIVSLSQIPQ